MKKVIKNIMLLIMFLTLFVWKSALANTTKETIEIENAIRTLDYNLKTIKIDDVLNRMGFPKNWKELANIERSVDKDE